MPFNLSSDFIDYNKAYIVVFANSSRYNDMQIVKCRIIDDDTIEACFVFNGEIMDPTPNPNLLLSPPARINKNTIQFIHEITKDYYYEMVLARKRAAERAKKSG